MIPIMIPARGYNNWKYLCILGAYVSTATAAKSLQSCLTLCDPRDGSPPRSPVPGILQARTLEWVAISFSNAWKWKVKVKVLSHVWLLATPWTAAYQAPPSMGFSRQKYWSGVPLPSPICINYPLSNLLILEPKSPGPRMSCPGQWVVQVTQQQLQSGNQGQHQWRQVILTEHTFNRMWWKWFYIPMVFLLHPMTTD